MQQAQVLDLLALLQKRIQDRNLTLPVLPQVRSQVVRISNMAACSPVVKSGSGVITSKYASIFSCLDAEITMTDRYPRPLGFLDSALSQRFVDAFHESGGKSLPTQT